MSVIVHQGENIDMALKRLQREVIREKILEVYKNQVYFITKSAAKIQKRREWKKMKRRRRAAARRVN